MFARGQLRPLVNIHCIVVSGIQLRTYEKWESYQDQLYESFGKWGEKMWEKASSPFVSGVSSVYKAR